MQKKLGVKYVYILWTPTSLSSDGGIEDIHAIAQLYEFPECREVGNGKFDMTKLDEITYLTANRPITKKDMMENFSENISTDIAKEMNMAKK
jgi:hypothetical protein